MLFENIIRHKFELGHTYDTCHHGIGPFAVSLHSFVAQEQERQEDEWFHQATMKMLEAVKHHSMKWPPPLPTSVGELLQLIYRLSILTAELFMSYCSLAMQLQALYLALQEREHKLMGNPDTMAHLIL